MRKTIAFLLLVPAAALAQRREDLLRSPKAADVKPPHFQAFTAEQIRDAVKVYSRRDYAVAGFNDSSVTVRLPDATNSIYAIFAFDPPRLTDARGRAVPFELEHGIFDFDTSSNEIRMTPKGGKVPVEFAHVIGKLTVKYPLSVKTRSVRKGSDKNITLDGPFVEYNKTSIEVPDVASFSKIEPLRAYDAAAKQIERADFVNSFLLGDGMWRRYGFWGNVAEVRIDSVEKWAEVEVSYDLPPAPKLPASAEGELPPLEQRLKFVEPPGGKVVKTLKNAPRTQR